jgi:hypothetical protein
MSQPPYQPYPGDPGPEGGYQPPAPGSYQPPAAPGSYPPPVSYPPPSSYPPPDQGAYPPPGQGSYPPGSYPPPPGSDQGAYPPPGPGYPGQGAPQYGMGPAPKKKSSALKIVLIVVGVIALLCIAGGVVAFVAAKDKVEQVVDATKITVVEPETLGGRPKADDPTLQSSVAGLDGIMSNIPGATGSVGGIYGDPQEQDVVMVAAASSINGSAQDRFDEFSTGLGGSGGIKIDNLTDTEPGPLGGIAKCGDTNTSGVPMAVCVWSDNGSVGMLAMMFKEKADLEKEFVALRGEVEKKS